MDWENLIILDACRLDYFTEEYRNYFDGALSWRKSEASCTIEWLKANWAGDHSVTYVSCLPYVNSLGVARGKYKATKHFRRILDVWDFGWSNEMGTTPPQAINRTVLDHTMRTNLIIHYAQPHSPYIGETKFTHKSRHPKKTRRLTIFPHIKRVQKMLASGDVTVGFLRKAYRDNLRLVLGCVKDLLPHLEGRTVVTADHGELLGEGGEYGHPCFSEHPLLLTVPWCVVKE